MTELVEVQRAARKASRGQPGFAYYMEMGLGKTLVALDEFNEMVAQKWATRMVVICPNSFKTGWVDEITKHGMLFRPHIFESGAEHENRAFLHEKFTKPPVLIINFEAIRKTENQIYIMQFIRDRNCILVIDESIQIKTYNSQQTKAVLDLAPNFQFVRILSGKPITQGPHDLWAQMKAIGAVKTRYWPFKVTFCKMGGFKMKQVVGAQNEELLAATIDKFIFRAFKKDWTDLPEKTYTSRQYTMPPSLAKYYKSMEDEFVVWLDANTNVAVDAFITKYIKLAQIQSGFIIQEDETVRELIPPEENPRFNLVRDIVEETDGKVVIPYNHRYTLGLLQRALIDYRPAYIKGQMDPEEIRIQKARFNDDPDCRVILTQIRASKYGHTLLGGEDRIDKCYTMIFAENSYSLDDRSQIEDRIHRHGQTENCLYIDVWGTKLDKRITAALQAKESIVKSAFQYFKDHYSSDRSRPS